MIQAASGDQGAWSRLVDHYARLVWAVTRSFRLSDSDAADVSQMVWLRLLEHIHRVDPERVGAWLVVTTRRECLRVLAFRKRVLLTYESSAFEGEPGDQPELDADLLADERAIDVRRALEKSAGSVAAAAGHADGRPAGAVRRDLRHDRNPDRQHRPDPWSLPAETQTAACLLKQQTRRPVRTRLVRA